MTNNTGDADKTGNESDEVWVTESPEDAGKAAILRKLEATRRPSAKTAAELKEAMLALISSRYTELNPAGVRLNELNRRFGVLASRFGTTARDLVIELLNEDKVSAFEFRDSFVVVDKAKHTLYMDMFRTDLDALVLAEQEIIRRAFPEQPSRKAKANKLVTW